MGATGALAYRADQIAAVAVQAGGIVYVHRGSQCDCPTIGPSWQTGSSSRDMQQLNPDLAAA